MTQKFDLEEYLTKGAEKIVKEALSVSRMNAKETMFFLKFAAAAKAAAKKRRRAEEQGEHIPSFLITSITSRCNLHCAGCYSRCTEATKDEKPADQLTAAEWLRVFQEAEELGISFILLAGGEPLLRRDVLTAAASVKNILFPVFTNGTFVDDRIFSLFSENRNLLPVLSMEGGRAQTDARRGKGVFDRLMACMKGLRERRIFFGVSVTVTRENAERVTSDAFVSALERRGCKAVFYIEYVPMDEETRDLAPDDAMREEMSQAMDRIRADHEGMMVISFPGDEKKSGGCLAAGRGFIHINSQGGAEPCPFSPYSDVNVRNTSLRNALRSPLFRKLASRGLLTENHIGGCVLFEQREEVEQLLQ